MDQRAGGGAVQGVIALTLSYFVSGAGGLIILYTSSRGHWRLVAVLGYTASLVARAGVWPIAPEDAQAPPERVHDERVHPRALRQREHGVPPSSPSSTWSSTWRRSSRPRARSPRRCRRSTCRRAPGQGENVVGTIRHPDVQWENGTCWPQLQHQPAGDAHLADRGHVDHHAVERSSAASPSRWRPIRCRASTSSCSAARWAA